MTDGDDRYLLPEQVHRLVVARAQPVESLAVLQAEVTKLCAELARCGDPFSNWQGYNDSYALIAATEPDGLQHILDNSELEWFDGAPPAGEVTHRFRIFNGQQQSLYADVYCGFCLERRADTPGLICEVRTGAFMTADTALDLLELLVGWAGANIGLYEPADQQPAAPDIPLDHWVSWATFIPHNLVELPPVTPPALVRDVPTGRIVVADTTPFIPGEPRSVARLQSLRDEVGPWLPKGRGIAAEQLRALTPAAPEVPIAQAPPPVVAAAPAAAPAPAIPPRMPNPAIMQTLNQAEPSEALPFRTPEKPQDALPAATPFRDDASALPPAPDPLDQHPDFGATIDLDDGLEQLGSFPFEEQPAAPDTAAPNTTAPNTTAPRPPSNDLRATALLEESPNGEALPFDNADPAALGIEHYAAFCVARNATPPEQWMTLRQRYGLADEAAEQALDHYYHQRFQRDPDLMRRWMALCSQYSSS